MCFFFLFCVFYLFFVIIIIIVMTNRLIDLLYLYKELMKMRVNKADDNHVIKQGFLPPMADEYVVPRIPHRDYSMIGTL